MRRQQIQWATKLRKAKKRHDERLAVRKKAFRDSKRQQRRLVALTLAAEARRRGPKSALTPKVRRTADRLLSLKAPRYLSLFGNTEETLAYCNKVRTGGSRPNAEIYLDFESVEKFTSDALLLIRAIMDECDAPGAYRRPAVFSGNLPSDETVATEFKATGFFKDFVRPPADLPKPEGIILKASKRIVDGDIAAGLCRFAVEKGNMNRRRVITSFRNLVELMNNTHEHARSNGSGHKGSDGNRRRRTPQPSSRWFASVYCRDGVAYFNFLDFGVGIMGTAPVKRAALRLQRRLGIQIASTRLLEEVFDGRAGSSTEKPGRGHGLPNMKRDATRPSGLLQLRVLTSNVSGTVANSKFGTIKQTFRGTFYHWQVRQGEIG